LPPDVLIKASGGWYNIGQIEVRDLTTSGKAVFFEMEEWGIDYLKRRDLIDRVDMFREPLHERSIALAPDAEIISVFIYSEVTREVIDGMPALKEA
jgi:hypothetical protein